jgi:hypothetical protein
MACHLPLAPLVNIWLKSELNYIETGIAEGQIRKKMRQANSFTCA